MGIASIFLSCIVCGHIFNFDAKFWITTRIINPKISSSKSFYFKRYRKILYEEKQIFWANIMVATQLHVNFTNLNDYTYYIYSYNQLSKKIHSTVNKIYQPLIEIYQPLIFFINCMLFDNY